MFQSALTGIRDLIFPRNCLLCKRYLGDTAVGMLCGACQSAIEANRPPFCARCSRHLKEASPPGLCRQCSSTTYYFDRAWAVTAYTDTMKQLIHLFKYKQRRALRTLFAGLLAAFIDEYHIDMRRFDVIVPIPLHPSRLRERGYNQSQLIAEDIARAFQRTESHTALIRTRPTKTQALLGKKERWTNMYGAFKIVNPAQLTGQSVLIVDDLFTTGATASEAARALKEAGAKTVSILALAIAQ